MVQVAMGNEDKMQRRKVLERNPRGEVPLERVKAFEVEGVGEKILFVQMNQDGGMTNENSGVLSLGESNGATRKIGSPFF